MYQGGLIERIKIFWFQSTVIPRPTLSQNVARGSLGLALWNAHNTTHVAINVYKKYKMHRISTEFKLDDFMKWNQK